MSELNDLITKLCPNGVPYKKLGDLCVSGNKGMLKKNELIPDGKYPVVNGGMNYYGRYNQYNNDKECFVFSSRGSAGYVSYQRAPFYAAALCYPFMSSNENIIMTRFMYFFLKQNEAKNIDKLVAKGSIPALNKADVLNIEIPVPPLPVQEEVVRILDSFTELEAELEAELVDRKKQYEYYRDYLLDKNTLERMDDKPIEMKKLGDLCTIETGRLNANKAVDDGAYPFFTTAEKTSRIDSYRWDTEALLIAGNANVGSVKHYIGKFEAYQRTYVLTNFNKDINVRFLFHFIRAFLKNYLSNKSNSAAMTYIVLSTLKNFMVLLPPLSVQERIVDILDRFDTLTTSLTDGIPAEIAMRREQYEYYRSRLLDFPRLPDNTASVSDGE